MKVNIDRLTRSILVRLDESPEILEDAVEYGSESFDLREMIRQLLPEVAEEVLLRDDYHEDLQEWFPMDGAVMRVQGAGEATRRIFPLPEDCLVFLYLRMSDWTYPVTELVPAALLSFRRMRDRERMASRVGSGSYRSKGIPAVAATRHDGRRALEIFGSVNGSRVAEGGYLPRPRADDEGNLIFPPSLTGRLIERSVEVINAIRR